MTSLLNHEDDRANVVSPNIPDISILSKSQQKELLRQLLEYEEKENKSNQDDVMKLPSNVISNEYDHIIDLGSIDPPKLSNFIPRYSSKSVCPMNPIQMYFSHKSLNQWHCFLSL